MDKLQKISDNCKGAVYLRINDHRNCYETVEHTLESALGYECPPQIEEKVYKAMIERDTIINLQFYPHTPIGSYDLYHYDLDLILDQALKILKDENCI